MKKTLLFLFLLLPFSAICQSGCPYDSLVTKHYYAGRFDSALVYAKMNVDYASKHLTTKDTGFVYTLVDLGVIARFQGDFPVAEEALLKAVEIFEKEFGGNSIEYANAVNELAALYLFLDSKAKAEVYYLKALNLRRAIKGKESKDYANSLNNLANLYRDYARYREADSLLAEAIPIIKKVRGEDTYELGVYFTNRSKIQVLLGEYLQAENGLYEAIRILKKSRGENHPYLINPYGALSEVYQNLNNYPKALYYGQMALDLTRSSISEFHSDYRNIVARMATIYTMMGNVDSAFVYFNDIINISRKQIDRNFSFLSDKEKMNFITGLKRQLNGFYIFTAKYNKDRPELNGIAYNNELMMKGLLLEAGKQIHRDIENSKDSTLSGLFLQLKKLRNEISIIYSTPKDKRIKDPADLEELANNIEKDLIRKCDAYAVNKASHSLSWQNIQGKLKRNEAAIEFISFKTTVKNKTSVKYFAMVVTKECSSPAMIPLFDESKLDSVLHNTNRSSTNAFVGELYAQTRGVRPTNPDQTKAHGKELYQMIWAPLDSILRKIKVIYYAPTGILHTISFAAIPDSKGNLLCDRYQLNCVGSTRQVAKTKVTSVKRKTDVLIYGGIEYSADSLQPATTRGTDMIAQRSMIPDVMQRGSGWNYLKGTLDEAFALKKILEKKFQLRVLTGKNASEETFKAMDTAISPEIIHIATHGFFIPEKYSGETTHEPLLRSGLILAGANRAWLGNDPVHGREDGILTAYEVSNINLSNTQLVVLSACETGLGDIKGSEGVYGLQRAFKMAGVDFVMMSLWQVPDKETVEFMKTFYENYLKTNDPRKAFSNTQRMMRKKYAPYYWAAFVLME